MEEASQTKKASIVPLGILRHADRMCRFLENWRIRLLVGLLTFRIG